MARVLQLAKRIVVRPVVEFPVPFSIRSFGGGSDVDLWLKLHADALDRWGVEHPFRARRWDVNDFRREFLQKTWWRPRRMWLAEAAGEAPDAACAGSTPVRSTPRPVPQRGHRLAGTVTLAMRGRGPSAAPVVHWLLVSQSWRRCGLGTALMRQLERECWELGHRDLYLETLSSWTEAVSFYESMGFRPAKNRPRA